MKHSFVSAALLRAAACLAALALVLPGAVFAADHTDHGSDWTVLSESSNYGYIKEFTPYQGVFTIRPDNAATEADIHAAEALYDALSPHQQEIIPEAGQKLAKLLADLSDYRLTQGDGSSWRKGSGQDMTFTVNGPLSRFAGVLVDGEAVAPADYTVEEGGTIVTLKQAYLEGLAVGDHILTVEYQDGAAAGSFEVLEAKPWTPGPTATPAPAAGCFFPPGPPGAVLPAAAFVV